MNHLSSSRDWHSPLASSLPYISSVSSYSERGVIMSMGQSPAPYDDDELQYPFDEEMVSSTEYIQPDSMSSPKHMKLDISTHIDISTDISSKRSSITTSDDGSDEEIDEIRRAINKTLGSKEDETPQQINPRAKYLLNLGIGKKTSPQPQSVRQQPITRKSSQSSQSESPRTPPTSPIIDPNDDSLDAMLALMGVSDDMMTTPHVMRSSPIDIPRRVSRPIPIPARRSRPISRPVHIPTIQQQSHKYDSDDETESYFDSPQSEDLSGSMLFDY